MVRVVGRMLIHTAGGDLASTPSTERRERVGRRHQTAHRSAIELMTPAAIVGHDQEETGGLATATGLDMGVQHDVAMRA